MKKTTRAILAALLCFSLLLGALVMTGCDQSEAAQSDEGNDKNDNKVTDDQKDTQNNYARVVVMRNPVEKGSYISSRDIEIISVEKEDLPEEYITARIDAIGMIAQVELSKGDILSPSMIAKAPEAEKPDTVDPYEIGYVV
ncbi:MAG: flagella basal body P-ring formation protein FlgA, partial [Clostridia bacterium]|nr:flagella basal body P-ring formation protein FlgA [Clostridia bacterium]